MLLNPSRGTVPFGLNMTTPFASRKPATSSNKGWSGPARAQCASAGRRWAPAVQPQDVMRTPGSRRSEEHTSELQSHHDLVCRLLLEKKNNLQFSTPL